MTNSVPLPEKGPPGAPVGAGPDFVVVLGGDGRLPVLGRYLIPVAGQSDLAPSGSKLREPRAGVEYHQIQVHTWFRGNECSRLQASSDMVKIPYLVQFTFVALDFGFNPSKCLESSVYGGSCVCPAFTGDDPGIGQDLETRIA